MRLALHHVASCGEWLRHTAGRVVDPFRSQDSPTIVDSEFPLTDPSLQGYAHPKINPVTQAQRYYDPRAMPKIPNTPDSCGYPPRISGATTPRSPISETTNQDSCMNPQNWFLQIHACYSVSLYTGIVRWVCIEGCGASVGAFLPM